MELKKVGKNGLVQTRLDTSRLDIIENILHTHYMVRLGILGSKASRNAYGKLRSEKKGGGHMVNKSKASILTNAEIGLIQEKGSLSRKIPRRSFLEMPITTELPKQMGKVGQALIDGLTKANIKQTYNKLGAIGEGIVLAAFGSSGYGSWAANKASTIARKHSSQPLIDSGQLRKSISYQVVKK